MYLTHKPSDTGISIPSALKMVGVVTGCWAVLTVLSATLALLAKWAMPGRLDRIIIRFSFKPVGNRLGSEV